MVLHHEVYLKEPDGEMVGVLRLLAGKSAATTSDPFLYCVCCDDPAIAAVKEAFYACKCSFAPCAVDSRGVLRLALLHRLLGRRGEPFTAQTLCEDSSALVAEIERLRGSANPSGSGADALVHGIYHVHAPVIATAVSSSSGSVVTSALVAQLLDALATDGLLLRLGSGYQPADMLSLRAVLGNIVAELSILNPFYYYTSEDRSLCLREEDNRSSVLQRAGLLHSSVARTRWEKCYDAYVVATGEW